MSELSNDPPCPETQTKIVKKHYNSLYYRSILSLLLNAIPAMLFTLLAIVLYFGLEVRWGIFYEIFVNSSDIMTVLSILAAISCWGLFFWLQVRRSHKRAELWRKSMESYEALVFSESQFKTEEEKKQASRHSVRRAERNRLNNAVKNEKVL